MVAQTVVSVGPYAFKKFLPDAQRASTPSEQTSPAEMSVFNSGKSSGSMAANNEGGKVTIVIRDSRIVRITSAPLRKDSGSPSHRAAPDSRAVKISETEASKLKDAN